MKLVGKIFIFLTLVMSIAFMIMAVMVYATHKNWRLAVERTQAETMPGEQLGLRHQLQQQRDRYIALQGEKRKLEEQVTAESMERDQKLAKLEAERDELLVKRDQLQKERDALFAKDQTAVAALATSHALLERLTKEVEGLRKEVRDTQEDRDKQFAQVVDLTDQIHQSEGEMTRVKERKAQLEAQYAKLKDLARKYNWDMSGFEPPVPLRGKVLEVSGENLVEVSIGSDDGLKVGNTLEVYRGAKYLGRLEVLKADVDRSVGKILPDFKRGIIQKGDDVATRLKLG